MKNPDLPFSKLRSIQKQIIIIIHNSVSFYSGALKMTDQLKDVDKNVAFVLELVLGLFGFLGIGWIYAGDIPQGVLRLVIYMAALAIAWTIVAFLILILIGLCLIPVMIAAQVAVPVWSAVNLKNRLDEAYPEK